MGLSDAMDFTTLSRSEKETREKRGDIYYDDNVNKPRPNKIDNIISLLNISQYLSNRYQAISSFNHLDNTINTINNLQILYNKAVMYNKVI